MLPHHGCVIDLEVAGVDDGAEGRVDDEADRVRDGVRDGERLDGEGARLDLLAGLDDLDMRLVEQPMLAQLDLDEAAREPGAEHGGQRLAVVAQGAHQEGQRADVVLVAVGEEDGAQAIGIAQHVAEVRDHEVDPGHLLLGEHQPDVDGDHVVALLVEHHVAADLAESAEGDDPQGLPVAPAHSSECCSAGERGAASAFGDPAGVA